ncbi:pilus assembly protein TadG-related protein (plasmid) [Streptomyces sp. NBC_00853]|uniref:pilus assembly protein TadG-related protein n=1 Tax=Streptomyces sp. NBC_00853 TaxID=2903681 RepID=UPI002886697F|nr:pilus assembly protein TadG-related protein [Streptomyces sp. DSM 41633]WTA24440.1 pilus assembly protein TadG-related protein [Streptomyces sp. NBC_00853]
MITALTRRITALRDRIRHGGDRGSLSPFYALSAIGIIMIMGLLVDGGGALNATNKATGLAQEAARAAGQQLNVPAAVQGTEITVDPDAAVAAAQDYLAGQNVSGSVTVTDGGQRLEVTVHDTYTTLFAQFVGRSTISVSGTAHARLHTQAGG